MNKQGKDLYLIYYNSENNRSEEFKLQSFKKQNVIFYVIFIAIKIYIHSINYTN